MKHTHTSEKSFPRRYSTSNGFTTVRGVWQDNPTPPRARTASPQPAPPKKDMRPHQMNSNHARVQNRPTPKRQTIHTTLHLKPRVRAELDRKAREQGLSVSATGAALVEWSLQQSISAQHGALLETIIHKSIGKHMRAYSTRLAVLLVRAVFATEQTRSIVTNILGRQSDMTQETLEKILTATDNKARSNITRITPQLKTLIDAIEKQFVEEVTASV